MNRYTRATEYEWLAHRFENMTAKEALLFRGAMQIEQPQATCDVMQIANQLEHYELLYGAGNDFALGNFVMEHIFYPSSQTREFLDPAKVGAAYRQKDGNTFCDGNFIRLSSPLDLSQNSDPAMLPDRGDYGIRVKLASRNNMEGIWVGFPDTVIAAPITSRRKTNLPTHVSINRQVDKLRCNSVILMEQIRTIDKSRLMDRIGVLNDYEMQQVNQALGISVGLV